MALRAGDEQAFRKLEKQKTALVLCAECDAVIAKVNVGAALGRGLVNLSAVERMAVEFDKWKKTQKAAQKRKAVEDKQAHVTAKKTPKGNDDDSEYEEEDEDGGQTDDSQGSQPRQPSQLKQWLALMEKHGHNIIAAMADDQFDRLKLKEQKVRDVQDALKRVGDDGNGLINHRFIWCARATTAHVVSESEEPWNHVAQVSGMCLALCDASAPQGGDRVQPLRQAPKSSPP